MLPQLREEPGGVSEAQAGCARGGRMGAVEGGGDLPTSPLGLGRGPVRDSRLVLSPRAAGEWHP